MKVFVPDEVAIFERDTYVWRDPWLKKFEESVLRLVAVFRPDSYVQSTLSVNNGYEVYAAPLVYLPLPYGMIVRYSNRIDYTGGSWWRQTNESGDAFVGDYIIHDRDTITRDHRRLVNSHLLPMHVHQIFLPLPS